MKDEQWDKLRDRLSAAISSNPAGLRALIESLNPAPRKALQAGLRTLAAEELQSAGRLAAARAAVILADDSVDE